MTLTKKDLLAAVKLCNDGSGAHATNPTRTASNLARLRALRQYNSADETGSSSGSAEQIYLPPRTRKPSSKNKTKTGASRPLTSRLDRPSHSEMDVPNIRYYSKPKSLKARLSQRLKTEVGGALKFGWISWGDYLSNYINGSHLFFPLLSSWQTSEGII